MGWRKFRQGGGERQGAGWFRPDLDRRGNRADEMARLIGPPRWRRAGHGSFTLI